MGILEMRVHARAQHTHPHPQLPPQLPPQPRNTYGLKTGVLLALAQACACLFGHKNAWCGQIVGASQRCPPGESCPAHRECYVDCSPDLLGQWFESWADSCRSVLRILTGEKVLTYVEKEIYSSRRALGSLPTWWSLWVVVQCHHIWLPGLGLGAGRAGKTLPAPAVAPAIPATELLWSCLAPGVHWNAKQDVWKERSEVPHLSGCADENPMTEHAQTLFAGSSALG
eukprot:1153942-Pelagomonas_calceolata.AAC.2